MISIPTAILQELNALSSTGAVLFLVALPNVSPSAIYLARNVEDVFWNGHTYQKFWFELDGITVDSDGKLPEISLSVDNVGRTVQYYVEQADGFIGETLNLYIVNSNHLAETTPIYELEFQVTGTSCSPKSVTWKLGLENPFYLKYPANQFHQGLCRYRVFKDLVQCQYAGIETTCDRRWITCLGYSNQARFGGQPGIMGTLLDESSSLPTPSTGRFVTVGGVVIDTETGLMWQYYDYQHGTILYAHEQIDYADNLVYAGYSDWRLPRIDELITIVNYERRNPASYVELDNYPASTEYIKFGSSTIVDTSYYYWVDIALGGVIAATSGMAVPPSIDDRRTRCVRLGPFWDPIASRASSNTANTAIDSFTGLIWQKADDGTKRSKADALTYASGLSLDGYTAWRLPTVYELFGILDFTVDFQVDPMVCGVFTANAGKYWTGTLLADSTGSGWTISFINGVVNREPLVQQHYVRCVHDP